MKLSKRQVKDLVDAINWEINDPSEHLNIDKMRICLDKSSICYVKEAERE